ncbi:MAG TPA: hypothetical protein VF472_07180 [Burkholderiaceae bacterium]
MFTQSAAAHESKKAFFNVRGMLRQYAQCDYLLDFFPSETGGAAICLRYGKSGAERTLIYDTGSLKTGIAIADYVRKRYGTDTIHDLVCSHPGPDAIAGALPILEGLKVERLWMHRPWLHSRKIARFFASGFMFNSSVGRHYQDAFAASLALEEAAFERNVLIKETFQGEQIGPMVVMSPHLDWYRHRLIHDFESPHSIKRGMSYELSRLLRMPRLARSGLTDVERHDSPENESLTEWGEVTAEMESSAVLYGAIGGQGILLTGNAGIKALSNAAAFAERESLFIPSSLKFFQVPNRGDANHLSPSVLDRFVGSGFSLLGSRPHVSAFVSISSRYGGLPHEAVTNALNQRGASIIQAMWGIDAVYGFPFDKAGAPREINPAWAKRHD